MEAKGNAGAPHTKKKNTHRRDAHRLLHEAQASACRGQVSSLTRLADVLGSGVPQAHQGIPPKKKNVGGLNITQLLGIE